MSARDLVFTIAIDRPGSRTYTTMARMLVSSLRATGFDGVIAVLACGDEPCLRQPTADLLEVRLADPRVASACSWKYRSRGLIEGARYRRILYLDCDCLAVADVRPMLEGAWQLAYVAEYGAPITLTYFNAYLDAEELRTRTEWGINAGMFALAGDQFEPTLARWQEIAETPPLQPLWRAASDQPAWNRVVLDSQLATHRLDEGLVRLPFVTRRPAPSGVAPRVLHFAGVEAPSQLQAMAEAYFDAFGVTPQFAS